jgi:hypothetical protein
VSILAIGILITTAFKPIEKGMKVELEEKR